MNRRTLLLTLSVLLLAAASTWLSRRSEREEKQVEAERGTPVYFIGDFSATELGADGQPVRRLEGTHMSHFDHGQTVISEPHLTVYRPGEMPWEMTAKEGRAVDEGKQVQLTGGVRIWRSGPERTEITTATLNVTPERHYAETADPVTLLRPEGRLDAIGMQAFLDEERVVLHSNVKGTYETR